MFLSRFFISRKMKNLIILSTFLLLNLNRTSADADASAYLDSKDEWELTHELKDILDDSLALGDYSLLDQAVAEVINKTLIANVPKLAEIHGDNFTINSGSQDFGLFSINLEDLTLHGLEELIAETIAVHVVLNHPLEINNLTLYVPEFRMTANNYSLDGYVTFPIGNKVLPLSGSNGTFMIGLNDLRISMYVLMAKNDTGPYVDQLTMLASASSMVFHAENLMNDEKIGWAFNTVLNDAAIVAFEYYKDALIEKYKDKFKFAIGQVICKVLHQC